MIANHTRVVVHHPRPLASRLCDVAVVLIAADAEVRPAELRQERLPQVAARLVGHEIRPWIAAVRLRAAAFAQPALLLTHRLAADRLLLDRVLFDRGEDRQ